MRNLCGTTWKINSTPGGEVTTKSEHFILLMFVSSLHLAIVVGDIILLPLFKAGGWATKQLMVETRTNTSENSLAMVSWSKA